MASLFASASETYARSRAEKEEEDEGLLKKSRQDPSKMERDATTSTSDELAFAVVGKDVKQGKLATEYHNAKSGSLQGRRSSGARVLQAPKKRKAVRKNKLRWAIKGIIGFLALLILSKLAMKMCGTVGHDNTVESPPQTPGPSHQKLLNQGKTKRTVPEFAQKVHDHKEDKCDCGGVKGGKCDCGGAKDGKCACGGVKGGKCDCKKEEQPKKQVKEVRHAPPTLTSGVSKLGAPTPVVVAPDDVNVTFNRWDGQQGQTSMKYALEDDNAALMEAMSNLKGDETKTPKEEVRGATNGEDLMESLRG